MKKIGLILIILLAMTGCTNAKTKHEKVMESYAKNYYELHMKDVKQDVAEVTIEMLEKVNNLKGEEQYDLSELSSCSKDSTVNIYVDDNQKITKTEFNLKCK